MSKGISIAIDGPVAAGKGTIAPILAQELNGIYLDTGAMYRCVALYFLENKIDLNDLSNMDNILSKIKIDITKDKIYLNKHDVTKRIRELDVDELTPITSGIQQVRDYLILQQRELAARNIKNGITFIAEGRDIATHVIPDADLKIFLTASPHVRALRRYNQFKQRGQGESLEQILKQTNQRDKSDTEVNKTLVKDPESFGYFVLDDSNMSKEQTIQLVIEKVKEIQND